MPTSKHAKKLKVATKPAKKKSNAGKKSLNTSDNVSAKVFIERLKAIQSDVELEKIQRYFKSGKGEYGEGDVFMGVRMGNLFKLSEEFIEMPSKEIEKLLESSIHEVRAGAVSIMNKQGRSKKTTDAKRKEIYDLYLKRHDRINNWDLVDLGATFVIGRYLFDKPRNILYKLACSKNVWERRTAIVSTSYFIRNKQVDDTFNIAALLVEDEHDLIHKAAGGWIREAGKQARQKLFDFLEQHAASMPRTFLRYAIEHLDKKQKDYYMDLKKMSL
ncbi:MAG TPA: DNA alkylation repair protein [Chryseolinea sp.]|nr:DNA alkylation repair protein [Chryseolinea sp.]